MMMTYDDDNDDGNNVDDDRHGGNDVDDDHVDDDDNNAFSWPSSRPSPFAPPSSCEPGCPPSWIVVMLIMIQIITTIIIINRMMLVKIGNPLKPEDRSCPLIDDMARHHLNILDHYIKDFQLDDLDLCAFVP